MKPSSTTQQENPLTPKPPFDAFVFDLDGTLLDTLPDLVVLTNAVLRESGFPEHTSDAILGFVGNGIKALVYQAVPDDVSDKEVEGVMDRWKELYPQYGHHLTQPYPGVLDALSSLKTRGVKLAVLSNKFDKGVQEVVGAQLPGLFTVSHGECSDIPRKPNPAGLLHTIYELGTTPERTVYIGDSAGDMKVARNAGTYALGVSWGYQSTACLREAGAHAIINRTADLLRFA